jgi:Fe-S-cluster-containing hydrogenase component 2
MLDVIKSGVIIHDPDVCTGCGICELMCSLYQEGVQGPALARSHIIRQPFTANHSHIICQQCSSPGCYLACPLKDKAICVDITTDTVYVNEDECTGCGECIDACPFQPPRIRINTEKKVAFKCDLCRGREGGPICVEYCPFQALKLVSKDAR